MTDLIINGTAAMHSSLGARRYFKGVMAHLDWPGRTIVSQPAANRRLVRLKELCERGRRDAVYWSPAHRGPLFAHNHVVTVLDLINLEHVYAKDWRLPLLRANLAKLLDNAVKIVTISEASKSAILRNFPVDPQKILAIPGPTDLPLSHELRATKSGSDMANKFVLMITNSLPHKNTTRAVRALASSSAASRGLALRVVGSISAEARAACNDANLRLEEHRGIDDDLLETWIKQSKFLFSPSLDEGLNFPVADAVRVGANVLCSDIDVHREFYDGSVEFFDPMDTGAIRNAIENALDRVGQWFSPTCKPRFGISQVADAYQQLFDEIL